MQRLYRLFCSAGCIFLFFLTFSAQAQQADAEADHSQIERDYYEIPLGIMFEREPELSFYAGFEYTEGDYAELEKTKMSYLPLSFKYTSGAWNFRASTGYIYIDGKINLIPGTGVTLLNDIIINEQALDSTSDGGLADIYISGSYSVESLQEKNLFLDLTARVKIPTASAEKGLGTGKIDMSLQMDFSTLMGNFLPFGTVGYRFVGKSDRYNLQNTWFVSMGLAYYLNYDLTLGLSYDVRKSATVDYSNPQEIQLFADYQFNEKWGGYFYAIAGLSDGSPDGGAGFQLRYSY